MVVVAAAFSNESMTDAANTSEPLLVTKLLPLEVSSVRVCVAKGRCIVVVNPERTSAREGGRTAKIQTKRVGWGGRGTVSVPSRPTHLPVWLAEAHVDLGQNRVEKVLIRVVLRDWKACKNEVWV